MKVTIEIDDKDRLFLAKKVAMQTCGFASPNVIEQKVIEQLRKGGGRL